MANFNDRRLITEEDFRDISGVGNINDITPYLQPMYLAEEIFFQRIVGNDQFDRMVTWNNLDATAKAADPNNTANTNLINRYRHYIIFIALYISRVEGVVDYSDSGASVWNGGENGASPTEEQLNDGALFAWNNAQLFLERGNRWLRNNRSSYPLVGRSGADEVRFDLNDGSTFPFTNLD